MSYCRQMRLARTDFVISLLESQGQSTPFENQTPALSKLLGILIICRRPLSNTWSPVDLTSWWSNPAHECPAGPDRLESKFSLCRFCVWGLSPPAGSSLFKSRTLMRSGGSARAQSIRTAGQCYINPHGCAHKLTYEVSQSRGSLLHG